MADEIEVRIKTILDETSVKDTKKVLEEEYEDLAVSPNTDLEKRLMSVGETLRENDFDAIIPEFGRQFETQVSIISQNVARLMGLYDKIGQAQTKYDRKIAADNFVAAQKRAAVQVADLETAINSAQAFTSSMPAHLVNPFAQMYRKESPSMRANFVRMSSSNGSGFMYANGDQMARDFAKAFSSRQAQVGTNEELTRFIQEYGYDLAAALMPIMSTGFNREDLVGFSFNKRKENPGSIRQLLPKAFQGLRLTQTPEYRAFNHTSEKLSETELQDLESFILSSQDLMEEFELAGLAQRKNGRIRINTNATRENIDALGGRLASLYEAGARGISTDPNAEIIDVNDPKYIQRIASKNNRSMVSANRGMRIAEEMFPWIVPSYVETPKTAAYDKDIGKITASPRYKAGSFTLLPFENEGEVENLPVVNSLIQQRLAKLQGADKFVHNGKNTNEIYMKMPVEALQDFETTPEMRQELVQRIAAQIGSVQHANGYDYVFTGFTGTNAAFTRKDLYDQAIALDPNFFTNGENRRKFSGQGAGAAFGHAVDYMQKQRTDGEDIRDLYGTDLSGARVIVADLKKITGLDGQNWISNDLVPATFQGRDVSGKSTYSVFSMEGLRRKYASLIDPETGDLVFDKGGIDGGELRIPKGGSVILEDWSNIKANNQYAGLSQDEVNQKRTEIVRRDGIFAKTTADDAATSARYISSQAAASLSLDDKAREYFRNVYLERLAMLRNEDQVKELLFSGQDGLSKAVMSGEVSMDDPDVQARILSYRRALTHNVGEGNLLLPAHIGKYAMLQAWLPDVFNQLVDEKKLTEDMKAMGLEDEAIENFDYKHKIAYFASKADELMSFRNPDTLSGNQAVINRGAEDFFQTLADDLGLDKQALYADPRSAILRKWQTADEDGDTVFMSALRGNGVFGEIMARVLAKTAEDYKNLIEMSGRTQEEQEAYAQSRVRSTEIDGKEWNLNDPLDMATWFSLRQQPGAKMGAAHAVTVGAKQFPLKGTFARAQLEAESHYDKVSNGIYKNFEDWDQTPDEWEVLKGGAPFFRLNEWRNKATHLAELHGAGQDETKEKHFDQESFNKKKVDSVNFASIHDPHALVADFSQFIAGQEDPESLLSSVQGGNWDEIFSNLPEVSKNKEVAALQTRLRALRQDKLNGKFLAFDDSVVRELGALSANALHAITDEVNKDPQFDSDAKRTAEIVRRWRAAGGEVPAHLKEWGLTRSNIEKNPELKAEVQKAINAYGEDRVYARSDADVGYVYYTPEEIQADRVRRAHDAVEKKKAALEQAKLEKAKADQAIISEKKAEAVNTETVRVEDETQAEAKELTAKTPETKPQAVLNENANPPLVNPPSTPITNPPSPASSKPDSGDHWLLDNLRARIATAREMAKKYPDDDKWIKQLAEDERMLKEAEESGDRVKWAEDHIQNATDRYRQEKKADEESELQARTKRNGDIGPVKTENEEHSKAKRNQTKASKPQTAEPEENDENIRRLEAELAQAQAEEEREIKAQKNIEAYMADQAEYNRIYASAQDLSNQFRINKSAKRNKIEGRSLAEGYFNRSYYGEFRPLDREIADYIKNHPEMDPSQTVALNQLIAQARGDMFEDFANKGTLFAKEYADDVETELKGITNPASKQKKVLDNYTKTAEEAQKFIEQIDKVLSDPKIKKDDSSRKALEKAKENISASIQQGSAFQRELAEQYKKENNENALLRTEDLKAKYNKNYKKSGNYQAILRNREIDALQKDLDQQQREGLIGEDSYSKASEDLSKMRADAVGWKIDMTEGLQSVGKLASETASKMVRQFGRQMWQSAINETKKFVQEYDKSMTTIQMITLKSDDEIKSLGTGLIGKAKTMKMTVGDVTSTAESLYRQGLTDSEVNSRLDTILKFSAVSGTKAEDATKLITTAMNTGLVSGAQEAADIVTALGDSAATNAAQIEKGIEKAGAAAAVDGTSFAELAAMLTAITATTQLTGNVAGTTMNSIFGRMNKIGTNELIEDENGNKISASAIATLLREQGIQTHINGEKRSSFDILKELSTKWQSLSDAEQQRLSTAIAGTRQYSNFSAIMLGMAEGNIDQYLDTAGESEGIVDKKYEVYTRSLEAALNDLKTTWDSLVAGIQENDIATGLVDGLTSLLSGFSNIQSQAGSVVSALILIAGAISAIGVASAAAKLPGFIPKLLGIAAGAAVVGGASLLANQFKDIGTQKNKNDSPEALIEKNETFKANAADQSKYYQNLIDETNILAKKIKEGTATGRESSDFASNVNLLGASFESVGASINSATSALEGWESASSLAQNAADEIAEANKKIIRSNEEVIRQNIREKAQKDFKEASVNNGFSKTGLDLLQTLETYRQGNVDRFEVDARLRQMGLGLGEGVSDANALAFYDVYSFTQGNSDNPFKGRELTTKALLSLAGTIFTNRGASAISKALGEGGATELGTLFEDSDSFVAAFQNGFKDTELSFATYQNLISLIGSIISGNAPDGIKSLIELSQENPEERKIIERAIDDQLANTDQYASLGSEAKEIIRKKAKSYASGLSLDDAYNFAIGDRKDLEAFILSESKEAANNPNYVEEAKKTGTYVPVSISESVAAAYSALTGKNRKYDTEYQALLSDVVAASASENPIEALKSLESSRHSAIVGSEDAELLKIWNDVNENNGQGVYSVGDLRTYLENKVFSSTPAARKQGNLNTAYNLSQANDLLQRLASNDRSHEALTQLASMTGLDIEQVLANQENAISLAQDLQNQNVESYLSKIRSDVDKEFGEELKDPNKRNKDLQDRINKSLQGTGVSLKSFDENGNPVYEHDFTSVNRRAGVMDYSTQYTNAELMGYAKQLAENGGTWNEMFATGGTYHDWSNEQINAVASYSPALARYLKMSADQRASAEGQALKQQYEIQFKTEGLGTLEQAGNILQGTASLVERLNQNGTIKLKAEYEIASNATERLQRTAMLNNGSLAEQTQAVSEITGRSASEIQTNFTAYKQEAQEYIAAERAATKSSYQNLYEKADSEDVQEYIKNQAAREGFILEDDETEGANGKKVFVDRGASNDYNYHENAFLGSSRSYTDLELANARNDIIHGKLSTKAGDYELYRAASASGGRYFQEYNRMLAENSISPRTYSRKEMREAKRRMVQEEELARRDAEESQALEDAKLASGTLFGAQNYARVRYEQNNKTGLAADAVYQALNSVDTTEATWIESLKNVLSNENNKQNIIDLINSSDAAAKAIEDAGIAFNEDGSINLDRLTSSANGGASTLAALMQNVAGLSTGYSDLQEVLTAQETGKRAQQAFNNLQKGYFISQGMAEQVYDQERRSAEEEIRNELARSDQYKDSSEEEINRLVDDQLKNKGLASLNDYLEKEQKGILEDQDYDYLKTVLGEGLSQKALSKSLNEEETSLANTLLENAAYGYNGLSASQRLEGIKEIGGRIANNTLTGYSSYAADQYMSGWSGWPRFSQLQQQLEENGKLEGADLQEYQALSAEFENLQKNAEIEIKIQGLAELEEAGKIIQGTADTVKQLQKGGSFEIQARVKLVSDLYSEAQLDAMLNSGNANLVNQAAQQITGVSGTQYNENRDYWIQQAQAMRSTRRTQTAESLMKDYNAAQDKEAFLASLEGAGWSLQGSVFDKVATANYQESGIVPEGFTRRGNRLYRDPAFVYNQEDYKFDNPYVNAEKNYTDAELLRMRRQIQNGTLTEGMTGYETAFRSGGTEWAEYQRLLANLPKEEERTEKQRKSLEAQRQRMLREESLSERDILETEELENARLQSGSLGGMFSYAQLQYQQNNRAGMAANALYETLSGAKVESVDDLLGILGDEKNAQNWKDLIESSPELTKKFNDLGITMDKNGQWDVSGLQGSADAAAGALSALAQIVASTSAEYNKRQEVYSTGEKYSMASRYLSGDITDEEAQYAALEEVIGNSAAAQQIRNYNEDYTARSNRWLAGYNEALESRDPNAAERYLRENPNPANEEYDPLSVFSPEERSDVEMMMTNAKYGGSSLTEVQQYNKLQDIYAAAQNGGLAQYMNEDTLGLYNQVGSSIEGFGEWAAAVQSIQEAGLSLSDFSESSEDFKTAIEKSGSSMGRFAEINKSMNAEIRARGIETMRKYGQSSSDVANYLRAMAKGGKEASNAQAQLRQKLSQWNNAANAIKKAEGKSGKQLADKDVADLSAITGEDSNLIKEMTKEQIENLRQNAQGIIDEGFVNELGGIITEQLNQHFANNPVAFDMAVKADVNGDGALDLSEIATIAQELRDQGLAELAAYAGLIGTLLVNVTKSGNSATAIAEVVEGSVNGSGKRTGGGGGGGGGGKSAVDQLLERQKHEIAQQQHEIKMSQIQEAHYERLNDYDNYLSSLDEEIEKQTELYNIYQRHLKELIEMQNGLEKYSDDWWKLQEQINSSTEAAEEYLDTVAEINAKKITATQTKQENEDKPGSHRTTMFEKRAQYYMDRGQFENYAVLVEKEVAQMRADIALNDKQITEWEGMLTQYEENSKEWIEVRDKIWATKEENADLENQAFERISELQQQRISQIQTDYQNGVAPIEHEQNMLGIWGSIYQNAGRSVYYDEEGNQHTMQEAYRNTLDQDTAYNEQTLTRIRSTIKLLQEQMATLDEGTEAWYAARDAIYQYEEQEAQLVAKNQENDIAKEESYVTELTDKREARTKELEHELNMIETIQERFENSNDYENSENMMEERRAKLEEMREQAARNLEEAQALLNSGKLDPGGDRYKTVRDDVMQLTEEYEKLTNEVENADRKIQETKLEHILEKFENQDGLIQHQLKLVQYEQTRYQNSGELTNYGTMLEIENDLQRDRAELLKEQIGLLEEQLEAAEPGSDTYQKITKEIYKMEESLASVNNTIEKNNEAIRKNQENIVKTRKALIDMIDREIKTRVKEQRDRLNAEVSIQNQILNIIRNRYKQEWAIVKADIDKKKQALQEEKALINERLNARINAEKEEERYTKLSELQRQLTLISADPTRTKDAIELQRQIDDLLKEIANETAQQEANAAGEQLDDQIKAYDAYAQYTEEALNEMLKDANSTELFEELNAVMGDESMSREERLENYMNWIKENDDNYKFGTEAMRLQLEQNNTDSWNKMLGFVDTYWDQVEDIISGGAQSIIDYMKESSSYIWNSDAGQRLLELQWNDTYDKYVKSTIDDAVFNDIHELAEYASQLQDYTYKVELTPESIYRLGIYDSELKYQYERDKSVSDEAKNYDPNDMYKDVGKKVVPVANTGYTAEYSSNVNSGGNGGSNGKGKTKYNFTLTDDASGQVHHLTLEASSQLEALEKMQSYVYEMAQKRKDASNPGTSYTGQLTDKKWNGIKDTEYTAFTDYEAALAFEKNLERLKRSGMSAYASGGLVDYTGPAWVDGTPTRPEAFLDATDTENIRAMLDALNYVPTMPMLSPSEKFFGNSSTVGDINIVINQAELKSDADYNEVARRVGQAFTKQLSKDGFQLSGYNW